jgi:two-component sensor histidine kinase/sensor domain CHASE-containing protein
MRRRILLVIAATLLVMMVIIFTVTRTLLLGSYARLERRYVERDLERVFNAITDELASMEGVADSLACSDQAYRFMQGRNSGYPHAAFDSDFFEDLDISVVAFMNEKGRAVFSRSFDPTTQAERDVPPDLAAWFSGHPEFSRSSASESLSSGIIRISSGPMLAVSHPVLLTGGQGTPRGTLVLGRFLDNREAARLAERLRISLAFLPPSAVQGMARRSAEGSAGISGQMPYLDTSRESELSAYSIMRDVTGAPAIVFRVDAPRDIHQQGVLTMRYFYAWLLFIGVVFGAVVLLFVQWRILAPLFRLSAGVLAVGTGGDSTRRVPAAGKDQIAYLGAAINGMLDARERSTEQLRASERRNNAFLDAAPDAIFRVTRDGVILDARSPSKVPLMEVSTNLVGRDTEQVLSLYPFIAPGHFERSVAATKAAIETGTPQILTYDVEVEGTRRFFEERVVASGDEEAIVLVRDVTAQKQSEEARRNAVLLKEIHHRVKNNLQVISSLLALQAGASPDPKTRALLAESRDRVRSMALIHEKLYQTADERGISFAGYVRDLATHLRRSYAGNSETVVMGIDMEEVSLNIDLSVPCGLIINELLSNSLKYAFPDGRKGTIGVTLRRTESGTVVLTISDDGVGMPKELDFRNASSLGLRIVNILVEQIKGTLELNPARGTSFTVTFPIG